MPECAPCPKTERPREGQERATCRCPPHARRTAHGSLHGHARATGTSSPPHDVQTASSQPRPREGGRPASGVPFRDGRATAQAHNGRRSPKPGQRGLVGLGRLERPTSRLSGVRSNQLSYRPESHPAGPRTPRCARSRANPAILVTSDPRSDGCLRRDVQTATRPWPQTIREDRRRNPFLPDAVHPAGGVPVKSSSLDHDRSRADADFMGCLLERR